MKILLNLRIVKSPPSPDGQDAVINDSMDDPLIVNSYNTQTSMEDVLTGSSEAESDRKDSTDNNDLTSRSSFKELNGRVSRANNDPIM